MSAPEPPNPEKVAAAQAKYNKEAAISQAYLNMVNQQTPYGSLTYQQTGTAPDGTPIFSATTTLNPEQQALLDQQTASQTQAGQIANQLLTNASGTLTQMPDLSSSGITSDLMQWGQEYYQPIFDQQTAALEAKLQSQGIAPGTEAYTRAMQENSRNQNDYYTNLLLSGQGTAMQALQQQYQLPLSAYSTLMTGAQPASVTSSLTQTPQESVAAPDYQGAAYNSYQAEANNYNNMLSGLFGIGSNVLGGWAMSDRRVKEDVKRIGQLDDGTIVYRFRYRGSDMTHMGVMAQEVEQTHPDAVMEIGGVKHVNYSRLAEAI